MLSPARERMKMHLRAEIDGEEAILWIRYLTGCLASGYEDKFSVQTPLDDLRTKQVALALTSYHRTLTRVLPDLKPMDLLEAMSPAAEGRDFSSMDRLELANRLRHLLKNTFKQLPAPVTAEEFWE